VIFDGISIFQRRQRGSGLCGDEWRSCGEGTLVLDQTDRFDVMVMLSLRITILIFYGRWQWRERGGRLRGDEGRKAAWRRRAAV
jgi:hypothetical protein